MRKASGFPSVPMRRLSAVMINRNKAKEGSDHKTEAPKLENLPSACGSISSVGWGASVFCWAPPSGEIVKCVTYGSVVRSING